MDENSFLEWIPAHLDSMMRENWNLILFAPMPSDTTDFEAIQYFSSGSGWSQTLGVMNGSDTLWWYGDRNEKIEKFDFASKAEHCTGQISTLEGTDLSILIKTAYPTYHYTLARSMKLIKVVVWIGQIAAVVIILILGILLYSSRRKNRAIEPD